MRQSLNQSVKDSKTPKTSCSKTIQSLKKISERNRVASFERSYIDSTPSFYLNSQEKFIGKKQSKPKPIDAKELIELVQKMSNGKWDKDQEMNLNNFKQLLHNLQDAKIKENMNTEKSSASEEELKRVKTENKGLRLEIAELKQQIEAL